MIALLAWLLIGLILVLDVTVAGLFSWAPPLLLRLQDWWDERRTRRKAPADRPFSLPGYTPVKTASQPTAANPRFDARWRTAGSAQVGAAED